MHPAYPALAMAYSIYDAPGHFTPLHRTYDASYTSAAEQNSGSAHDAFVYQQQPSTSSLSGANAGMLCFPSTTVTSSASALAQHSSTANGFPTSPRPVYATDYGFSYSPACGQRTSSESFAQQQHQQPYYDGRNPFSTQYPYPVSAVHAGHAPYRCQPQPSTTTTNPWQWQEPAIKPYTAYGPLSPDSLLCQPFVPKFKEEEREVEGEQY